jgi:hypothetical protein
VTTTDPDALKDRLDALSGRIDRRLREMKQRGAFSGIDGAGMDEIRRRSATIQERLDAAIARGDRFDALKHEFERDFHSLREDFEEFEQRLDAGAMK